MNMPHHNFYTKLFFSTPKKFDDWISVWHICSGDLGTTRVTLNRSTLMTHSIRPGVKPRLEICKWIFSTRWGNCFFFLFYFLKTRFLVLSWDHNVWKLLKMSHLKFSILAFSTNFCPINTDLSGNTVWQQSSVFQKLAKLTIFGILINFCPLKM